MEKKLKELDKLQEEAEEMTKKMFGKMTGIELISQERDEQIFKHKRTVESDKLLNKDFQLSEAAMNMCYLSEDDLPMNAVRDDIIEIPAPTGWNQELYNKMVNKSYRERLIIAGALIAAELDRINE